MLPVRLGETLNVHRKGGGLYMTTTRKPTPSQHSYRDAIAARLVADEQPQEQPPRPFRTNEERMAAAAAIVGTKRIFGPPNDGTLRTWTPEGHEQAQRRLAKRRQTSAPGLPVRRQQSIAVEEARRMRDSHTYREPERPPMKTITDASVWPLQDEVRGL